MMFRHICSHTQNKNVNVCVCVCVWCALSMIHMMTIEHCTAPYYSSRQPINSAKKTNTMAHTFPMSNIRHCVLCEREAYCKYGNVGRMSYYQADYLSLITWNIFVIETFLTHTHTHTHTGHTFNAVWSFPSDCRDLPILAAYGPNVVYWARSHAALIPNDSVGDIELFVSKRSNFSGRWSCCLIYRYKWIDDDDGDDDDDVPCCSWWLVGDDDDDGDVRNWDDDNNGEDDGAMVVVVGKGKLPAGVM